MCVESMVIHILVIVNAVLEGKCVSGCGVLNSVVGGGVSS